MLAVKQLSLFLNIVYLASHIFSAFYAIVGQKT